MSLDWQFMCAFDKVEYDETTFDRINDDPNIPTIILGIGTLNRDVTVFFRETNIIRAFDQLTKIIKQSSSRFPFEKLVPHVIEQIQTFTLRTCPISTMQQQQIGLDLFCFWPNTGDAPKFTLKNFKTWLFYLSALFNAFVHDCNVQYNTPPFIVNKFDILHDKILLIEENNIDLSELYVFNMAAAVFNFVSKMAEWARTTIEPREASLDPIKLIFSQLEHNFDLVAANHQDVIVPFISLPTTVMNFYKRNY